MPAFLLRDKTTTWFGSTGQLLAGGYWRFYVAGSTTPQDVYGERALTTNNGDTIDLDASGRLEHECWGDTADGYFAELYDANDVKQAEVSYLEVSGGAGQTIPIPNEGEFITGDGTNLLVAEVRQVPDPTGNANKLLGTDGTDLNWVARPADGSAGVSDTGTSASGFTIGNKRVQWGSGAGTSAGGRSQSVSITFPVPFSAAPNVVDVVVTNGGLSSFDNMPTHSITAKSATGFTVRFRMSELDDSGSGWNFSGGVAFDYMAIGPK